MAVLLAFRAPDPGSGAGPVRDRFLRRGNRRGHPGLHRADRIADIGAAAGDDVA